MNTQSRGRFARALRNPCQTGQIAGGRKGGLAGCEYNVFVTNEWSMSVWDVGKTNGETKLPKKLKHLSAQAAIALQSSLALLHGMPPSSDIDMSNDLEAAATPPNAGTMATDKAITMAKTARMLVTIG